MKCQSLFSVKNKKTTINLSSARFAHSIGKINVDCAGSLENRNPTICEQ